MNDLEKLSERSIAVGHPLGRLFNFNSFLIDAALMLTVLLFTLFLLFPAHPFRACAQIHSSFLIDFIEFSL